MPATQNVPFGASSVITEAGHRDVPNGGPASVSYTRRRVLQCVFCGLSRPQLSWHWFRVRPRRKQSVTDGLRAPACGIKDYWLASRRREEALGPWVTAKVMSGAIACDGVRSGTRVVRIEAMFAAQAERVVLQLCHRAH
jgi:hypothetical protein